MGTRPLTGRKNRLKEERARPVRRSGPLRNLRRRFTVIARVAKVQPDQVQVETGTEAPAYSITARLMTGISRSVFKG